MPTLIEIQELLDNCTWVWTSMNGVNGHKVTGPNGNFIFLPAAGCRRGTSFNSVGASGYYWSASPYNNSDNAYSLYFYSEYYCPYYYDRNSGRVVRPVSE